MSLQGRDWILIGFMIISIVILAIVAVIVVKTMDNASSCPRGYICTPKQKQSSEQPHPPVVIVRMPEQTMTTADRDLRVLSDPLYPPLNRTDRGTFNSVVRETNARNINVPTRNFDDSYRLVGYLINKNVDGDGNKDAGGNSWKLMARQKDRNESDFYIIPTNKDYDVKVPLTPEVFAGGSRFKDVYDIPKEVQLVSPLLNKGPYEFVELPKSNFTDSYN